MSTVDVTVAPITPRRDALVLRRVKVRLVAGTYGAPGHASAGEILSESFYDLGFSSIVLTLTRNSDITPAGTFYEVSVPSFPGAKWWIQLNAGTASTIAVGDPTIQVQSPVGPGVAAGLAIIGSPGLPGVAGPPGDLSVDPTLIDGDIFSTATDGLLTARRSFRGRAYGDGVGGGPGATVIHSGRLQWGKADGTWPNPVGGASYGYVNLGSAVPDAFGVTVMIRSTTCQGGAASTDGAAFGLICSSNLDAQTDGQQIVLHGSIHITFGRTVWTAQVVDGSGFRNFSTGGIPMTAPFAAPLPLDTALTTWVRRIGDRIQLLLPDGTLITSDPDPQIPTLWGGNIVLEPYQPTPTYATDRRVEYLGWIARSVSTPVILDRAGAQSIPRETDGTLGAGRLPAFMQSSLTLASRHGTSGVYASTPDSAAVSITGDLDLRVTVEPDSWRPSVARALIGKWSGPYSYLLQLNTNGGLLLYWTTDGSTIKSAGSTAAIPSGTTGPLRVRATLQVNNGSAGNTANFYTSTDGTTWTALGTAFTQAGTTSVFDSTSPVELGSTTSGTTNILAGWIYGAEVRSGIGGAVVASWVPRYSYVAPTGETWTFNGSFKLISSTLGSGGGGGVSQSYVDGLIAGLVPGTWHVIGAPGEIAYQSGWSAVAGAPLRYRVEGDLVRFDGGAVTDGTGGPFVFIFPSGFINQGSFVAAYSYSTSGTSKPDQAATAALYDPGSGVGLYAPVPTGLDTIALTSVVIPMP